MFNLLGYAAVRVMMVFIITQYGRQAAWPAARQVPRARATRCAETCDLSEVFTACHWSVELICTKSYSVHYKYRITYIETLRV